MPLYYCEEWAARAGQYLALQVRRGGFWGAAGVLEADVHEFSHAALLLCTTFLRPLPPCICSEVLKKDGVPCASPPVLSVRGKHVRRPSPLQPAVQGGERQRRGRVPFTRVQASYLKICLRGLNLLQSLMHVSVPPPAASCSRRGW